MSKRDRIDWKGYLPAIVTPFNEDRSIDYAALAEMLEWLHAEGMHGLFIGGTTGEWTSLSMQERADMFRASAQQLRGKLPLLAGCTAYTPQDSIALAKEAEALGYDGVVVAPPPYLRPNDKELLAFYQTVAAATRLPLVIYNWPAGTGIDLSLDLLDQLTDIDNVVGIKQSSPSVEQFIKTLFRLKDKVRVYGFRMDELGLTLLRSIDGDGTMGAGGVLGRYQPDFYNHIWRGDFDAARLCGQKDTQLLQSWYTPELIGRYGSAPAVLKAAFQMRGLSVKPFVRRPVLEVEAAEAAHIRQTLIDLQLIR